MSSNISSASKTLQYRPVYWNVAFLRRHAAENWWDHLSPPWARHVMAYGWCPETSCWIVVNPAEEHLAISAVPDAAFSPLLAVQKLDRAVIIRVPARDDCSSRFRIAMHCATVVARTVGVRGSAWRPIALARTLLKGPHEVISDPDLCLSKLKPRSRAPKKKHGSRSPQTAPSRAGWKPHETS